MSGVPQKTAAKESGGADRRAGLRSVSRGGGLMTTAIAWLAVLPCAMGAAAHAAGPVWPTCRGARGAFGLGEIDFPNSGAPAAQNNFLRGVLLLYSFEYGAARREFRAAERADPGFALAYWGEALTYDETIWNEEDLAGGRAALARLGATPAQIAAKAGTPRERMYLASVEQLYGAGDKARRDDNYSAALHALVRRYPHDLEARTFYALSLLGLSGGVRSLRNDMHAAAEAEEVLQVEPCHPGALHYLIHATDDPVHAVLGLQAARRLAEVAPEAEHAVHMSSHIYMALGMWNDVIRANLASIRIARAEHMTGYHQMTFLIYAYLQENERRRAERWIRLIARETAAAPTRNAGRGGNVPVTLSNLASGATQDARMRLAYMRATWLVETRGAPGVEARVPVDSHGIPSMIYFAAQDFAQGITAGNDVAAARAALTRLNARIAAGRKAPHGVTTGWLDTVTPQDLQEAAFMSDALAGVIRFHEGDRAAGIAQVAQAAAAADRMPYQYGPPWSVKPLDELLGELLLADGQRAQAAAAFEKALAQYPGRRLALQDLAAARGPH
jgi:hypothetical protein